MDTLLLKTSRSDDFFTAKSEFIGEEAITFSLKLGKLVILLDEGKVLSYSHKVFSSLERNLRRLRPHRGG